VKYSVEDRIMRHPATGTEMGRPPVTVDGLGFLYYDLGGGLYVWRTPDQRNEVGRRGGGGTYYAKVGTHILEASFITLRDAMRAVAGALDDTVSPHAHRR